jgi:flagellar assembly factor FliW
LSAALRFLAMQISTKHFGPVQVEIEDIVHFPRGIVAFEDCRHWVLLTDAENPSLAWLQSVSRAEVALPVVSPRRFVPHYAVRLSRGQLAPLEFSHSDQVFVLNVVSQSDGDLTLNLKAPLVINLDRRIGRQIITTDDQPVALTIDNPFQSLLRKSA